MRQVAILDYGSGNLRSAERAFSRAGVEVMVTSAPDIALEAEGLVVPGVGAFTACMDGLSAINAPAVIRQRRELGRPTFGICVGMQVLFEKGIEHGRSAEGVGCWPGIVDRLQAQRLPHMGWNTIDAATGSQLFEGVGGERFYFIHSYAAQTWSGDDRAHLTWSEHGSRFLAAVEDGALWATQFHPEKSGEAGARVIANWIRAF